MERLARKFENARKLVPAPVVVKDGTSRVGILAFGTTDFALRESLDQIKKEYDKDVDYMRIRAYPFAHEILDFVASHDRVYVVEQNRDAQLAEPAEARSAGGPDGEAAQHSALQRAADRCTHASQRNLQRRRACKLMATCKHANVRHSAPGPKVNHIGLPVLEYRGGKSTLVRGLRP